MAPDALTDAEALEQPSCEVDEAEPFLLELVFTVLELTEVVVEVPISGWLFRLVTINPNERIVACSRRLNMCQIYYSTNQKRKAPLSRGSFF